RDDGEDRYRRVQRDTDRAAGRDSRRDGDDVLVGGCVDRHGAVGGDRDLWRHPGLRVLVEQFDIRSRTDAGRAADGELTGDALDGRGVGRAQRDALRGRGSRIVRVDGRAAVDVRVRDVGEHVDGRRAG